MENTPTLKTKRLILRQFTLGDLQAFFEIGSDKEVNTFLPLFPFETIKDAKKHLEEKYLKSYEKTKGFRYAVCLQSDNIPIGYVNLADDDSNDFGYGLKKEFWNQGIITEASKRVIEQLQRAGVPYITATHDKNNPKSGSVMQKLGMTYCYSYEELWQPKNIKVIFRMYQLNLDGKSERVYEKYWNMYPIHFIEKDL